MKKLLSVLTVALVSFAVYASDTKTAKMSISSPDFAYPRDVISMVEAFLAKNPSDGSASRGAMRLLAAQEYTTALTRIDNSKGWQAIELLMKMANEEKNEATRAMILTYTASVCSNYRYHAEGYLESPDPKHVELWGYRGVSEAADSLISLAVTTASRGANSSSLKDYAVDLTEYDAWSGIVADVTDFVLWESGRWRDESRPGSGLWMYASVLAADDAKKARTFIVDNLDNANIDAALYGYISRRGVTGDDAKVIYDFYTSILPHASERMRPYVEACIDWLKSPRGFISSDESIQPDKPFDLKLISRNTDSLSIKIYLFEKEPEAILQSALRSLHSELSLAPRSGMEADTLSVSLSLPAGYYYVNVEDLSRGKKNLADGYIKEFKVSPWTVCYAIFPETKCRMVQVLDVMTGAPVKGLKVTATNAYTQQTFTAKTDSEGIATFYVPIEDDIRVSDPKSGVELEFSSDDYLPHWGADSDWNFYKRNLSEYEKEFKSIKQITVSTDRPAYHPGDTVRFVAVARSADTVLPGQRCTVSVNVDSETAIPDLVLEPTDEYGRSEGCFHIPDDAKPGFGSINGKGISGGTGFVVADFKLTELSISNTGYELAGDSVRIYGTVINSGGDPRPGTEVKIVFEAYDTTITRNMTTNGDGKYSCTVLRDIAWTGKIAPQPYTMQSFTVTASTADGYNAEYRGSYPIIRDVNLSVKAENSYDSSKGLTFTIKTERLGSKNPSEPVLCRWAIINRNDTLLTGESMSGEVNLTPSMLATLPVGSYRLTVKDVNLYSSEDSDYFTLYNTDTDSLPVDEVFYLPESKVESTLDGVISLLIGCKDDNTTLWWTSDVSNLKQPINRLSLHKGYQTVEFRAPRAKELRLWSVRNGERTEEEITVTQKEEPKDEMTITLENFRDNCEAGGQEQWQLVTRLNDKAVDAAVALTVYDLRLNRFGFFSGLRLNPITRPTFYIEPFEMCFNSSYLDALRINYGSSFNNKISKIKPFPTWLYLNNMARFYTYAVSDLQGQVSGLAVSESMSRPQSAKASNRAYASGVEATEEESFAMDDVVVLDSAEAPAVDGGLNSLEIYGSRAPTFDVEVRTNSVLSALWRPMLTTSDKGIVDVTFAVPNQASGWQINAQAWTKDLHNTSVTKTFYSQKPLYVKPNLPRFVRVGDRVAVVTSIYNATDTPQHVDYEVEVAGVSSSADKTSQATKSTGAVTIAPKSNSLVTTMVEITGDLALDESLSLTFRARGDNYGDGERVIIPILSSSALVIESEPFYFNPGDTTLVVKAAPKGQTSLHFTANPMWTVVESLPSVIDSYESITPVADAYARAWYVARTAEKIVGEHPVAAQVIDVDKTAMVRRESLAALKKLARPNGGFAWGNWGGDASLGTTLSVLSWFDQDTDDKDIQKLLDAALNYVDTEIKSYIDSKGKAMPNLRYTLIRSAFGKPGTLQGQAVADATVNYALKNWKNMDLGDKCIAAMILDRNGYDATAREILRSISQHGVVKDSRGLVFPNMPGLVGYANLLETFRSVDPDNPLVDAIRQGLICYRRGANWGETAHTAYAVRAMIESGTDWVVPADLSSVTLSLRKMQNAECTLNSELCTLNSELSGAFSVELPESALCTLHSALTYPSYGAVVTRREAELSDTPAFGTESLKIEKSIIHQGEIKPGDKVTVLLRVYTDTDMTNVVITDSRSAAFEPVEQLGRYHGVSRQSRCSYYEQTTNTATNLLVGYLPKGWSEFEYDVVVNNAGTFTTGIATLTSDEDADLTAHSSSNVIVIK